MKTTTKAFHVGFTLPGLKVLSVVCCLLAVFTATGAIAQDLTITNFAQLAQEAFGPNHTLCIPFLPWQWEAFSIGDGGPWWVDCTQLPCDLLPVSTNLQAYGVQLIPVQLTKNVLTGETLVRSDSATDVVASVAAPSGYQPGQQSSQDAMIWRMWLQTTNCPDCWGIEGAIPQPTVMLKTFLADISDYATYQSNVEAEAEAEAAAQASSASSFAMSGMFTMSEDDEGGGYEQDSLSSCSTNGVLAILSVTQDTNGWTTLVWGPTSSNFLYEVQAAAALSNPTPWFVAHTLIGNCGTTSWTDKAAPQQPQFFWRIQQLNFNDDADGDGLSNIQEFYLGTNLHNADTDGDGIPDGWEVAHGLNPLDAGDASLDPDGDGYSNLEEYLNGTDPHQANQPLDMIVNGGQPYTASLVIPIQPLSTNYPNIRVSTDSSMTNATVLANSGGPVNYTVPDNGDGVYNVYVQYADAQGNPTSIMVGKMVILDRVAPTVYIVSPTSNAVLDQAFITLQAVAYDPDPTGLQEMRPLKIWINGQPFWDRVGTNIVVDRFPVPSGTNSFTVTIQVVDGASHTNQAARSWTVNPSGDTVAPQLSSLNITTNMLLPDVGAVWMEGSVDDSNALVSAVVRSGTGTISTNALNVSGEHVEGLIPLDSGTNQLIVLASDAAGNRSSNVFTVVRSSRYQAAITNPVFGVFALAPSNQVSGYVSAVFDAGLPTQTNVLGVTINGVAAVLGTNLDANGNVPFNSTNWVPLGQPITGQLIGGGLPNNPAASIPPAQSQVYEVTYTEDVTDSYLPPVDSGGLFNLGRVIGASCWNNSLKRGLSSDARSLIDDTGNVQYTSTGEVDTAQACLMQLYNDPDQVPWILGTPYTFSFTFPGPLSRSVSFGTDYLTGREQEGIINPVIVPGPCCCLPAGATPTDCSLPDITNDQLCHGYPRDNCTGTSGQDCQTFDHYATTLTESAALRWTRENQMLEFRAPREYGTNTTVIFTFEGVNNQSVSLDLSQLKFRGQLPVAYSNQTQTVSYLLTVDGGKKYRLSQDDFDWPIITLTNHIAVSYLNPLCYPPTSSKATWQFGWTIEQFHTLSWTNFHNQPEPMEVITGNYNGNDWAAVWNKLALPSPQVSAKNQTVFVAGRTKVADYIAQNTPTNGVTGIRYGAAINGNFFYLGAPADCSQMVGFVGTGSTPWSCGNSEEDLSNAGLRWGFGINTLQPQHVIEHDVEQSGGYYPGTTVRQIAYGLNNVGALILNAVSQPADTSWPDYNGNRCRALLVWSRDQQYFFMVAIGYSVTNSGVSWNGAIDFINTSFRNTVKQRPETRGFEVGDAIMLDGGTSSQLSFRRVVRDAVGSIQVQQQDIVDVWEFVGITNSVRQVPTMVNTYATIP